MKSFLMWFVFIGITVALFFSFIVAVAITTDAVTYKLPFLADVKEIAASEKYVYTLDSTFHNICKYDIDGNFICCISFGETGRSRIFCDSDGNLCRYSVRSDLVFVYDDDGNIIDTYEKTQRELIKEGWISSYFSRKATVGEKTYEMKNHLIASSRIDIGNRSVVVESVGYHIFNIIYILIAVDCAIFAFVNLIIFIIQDYYGITSISKAQKKA